MTLVYYTVRVYDSVCLATVNLSKMQSQNESSPKVDFLPPTEAQRIASIGFMETVFPTSESTDNVQQGRNPLNDPYAANKHSFAKLSIEPGIIKLAEIMRSNE